MKNTLFSILFLLTSLYIYGDCPTPISSDSNVQNVRETWVRSGDAQLFCRVLGKGKPLIVIHGGPGLSQDYLLPSLYELAKDNLVIFYDQRGSGKSTGEINSQTISIEAFVNDLDAIRQAFNLEKISLLGHSWGGFPAMHYAIAHPERVNKLILSNSMPATSEGFALFIQEWLKRMAPYQEQIASIRNTKGFEEGNPELREQYNLIMFRTYCYVPEKAELLNLCMTPVAIVNGAKVYDIFKQKIFDQPYDFRDSLKKLNVTTLIVHGDVDPIPASCAQVLHESIPHSKYILMKHCGHFPYVEDPANYFKYLHEFLNGSDATTKN